MAAEVTRGKAGDLAEFYFGLGVEPAPGSGAIEFVVYPLLEIGGKVVKTETEFPFSCEQK